MDEEFPAYLYDPATTLYAPVAPGTSAGTFTAQEASTEQSEASPAGMEDATAKIAEEFTEVQAQDPATHIGEALRKMVQTRYKPSSESKSKPKSKPKSKTKSNSKSEKWTWSSDVNVWATNLREPTKRGATSKTRHSRSVSIHIQEGASGNAVSIPWTISWDTAKSAYDFKEGTESPYSIPVRNG